MASITIGVRWAAESRTGSDGAELSLGALQLLGPRFRGVQVPGPTARSDGAGPGDDDNDVSPPASEEPCDLNAFAATKEET